MQRDAVTLRIDNDGAKTERPVLRRLVIGASAVSADAETTRRILFLVRQKSVVRI